MRLLLPERQTLHLGVAGLGGDGAMLVAIAAASGLGETVNAFEIMPKLFYPYMLLISSLLFIFFGKEKQK